MKEVEAECWKEIDTERWRDCVTENFGTSIYSVQVGLKGLENST